MSKLTETQKAAYERIVLRGEQALVRWSAKKGTRITFVSDQPITPEGTVKLGMVIWMDRDAVKKAAMAAPPLRQS